MRLQCAGLSHIQAWYSGLVVRLGRRPGGAAGGGLLAVGQVDAQQAWVAAWAVLQRQVQLGCALRIQTPKMVRSCPAGVRKT